uniref:G protein subunit beta 1 like n=1 Tax=Bos mutus grunniens TaxID=30521 RepID=A0A8B9YBR7_BOSMU
MAAPVPNPQFVLRGARSAVHALHFCHGAQGHPLLLSGSLRGLVHVWSLQTRRPLAALDGHGGQCVTWLHTLPQGPQLLSQGRDLQLCVWDLAEGRNAVVDAVHLESVGFCRASVLAEGPQRWMLAVPGRGSDEVQVLELPSKTSVSCLKPEAGARLGMPMCLQLWQAESSPRPLLLAGYEDGSLALWDVSARKVCSRVACHSEPVMALALDPRRARGVSGSAEKVLAVWSLEGQQALQVRGTHELINPGSLTSRSARQQDPGHAAGTTVSAVSVADDEAAGRAGLPQRHRPPRGLQHHGPAGCGPGTSASAPGRLPAHVTQHREGAAQRHGSWAPVAQAPLLPGTNSPS